MHRNSILLFEQYVAPLLGSDTKVLEIGPNRIPSDYRELTPSVPVWHTLDIRDHQDVTYPNAGEYDFPIPDGAYDVVLSGQVMEHVKKIWLWIGELERVCKPGGYVAIISPVSWPYHEAPVDCWRIYPEGMKALLDDTSLEIVDCHFESLECPQYKRHTPGRSLEDVTPRLRFFYKVAGRFGIPVERSYDLLTISRKS